MNLKYYIIRDKMFKNKYGITDKLWVAELFMIQRHEYTKNLTIDTQKDKKYDKYSISMEENYIRYLSGFALTNKEINFINYEMSMCHDSNKQLRKKYDSKKISQFIDFIEKEYKVDLIEQCFKNSNEVLTNYDRLSFFENLKEEMKEKW